MQGNHIALSLLKSSARMRAWSRDLKFLASDPDALLVAIKAIEHEADRLEKMSAEIVLLGRPAA